MFDAAAYHEQRRLPELFCGYIRKRRHGPVAYPVACSPQAWAAAAPFAFIAACLGIDIRHDRNEILFSNPVLPQFADELVVKGLRLGQSCLDVRFARHGSDVSLNVLDRVGSVRVSVMK
jgi:glycogen debranching enzyme